LRVWDARKKLGYTKFGLENNIAQENMNTNTNSSNSHGGIEFQFKM